MALRLKKVVPEFEDVDDGGEEDPQWITYEADKPNMEILNPLIKTAEAMIDPRKAGAYYLKVAAAKKLVAALGEGWGIEANKIAKVLPFAVEWHYQLPEAQYRDQLWDRLRKHLDGMAKKVFDGIKGISFFTDGKRPDKLKEGYLYIGIRKNSSGPANAVRCMGQALTPTGVQNQAAPVRINHGIPDDDNLADIAFYGPRIIYLRYWDNNYYLGDFIASAIKNGAQLAMKFEGGSVKLDKWLQDGVDQHKLERAGLIEKAKADSDKSAKLVTDHTAKLQEAMFAKEAADDRLTLLARPVTPEVIAQQYPLLKLIKSVNRDDPTITIVKTDDIIVGDMVNLGEYTINIHHGNPRVHVVGTNKPDDVVHPNIYQDKAGKWNWDLAQEKLNELIQALAVGRMHQAAQIVIENLLDRKAGDAYAQRLGQIVDFQKKKEEKLAAKKNKKAIEEGKPAQELKVEEAVK